MKRYQGLFFFGTFMLAAGAVAFFVSREQPLQALSAGVAGIALHSVFSRSAADDGEVADSSYFLGFLLTLVFLTAGVWRLGRASTGEGTASTEIVFGFLEDLAAGLVLTIVGLMVRQVRTLGSSSNGPLGEQSLAAAQVELTKNLQELIGIWGARPEQEVLRELRESSSLADNAVRDLERSVAAASQRMIVSVGRLEEATSQVADKMTREASKMGGILLQTTERVEAETTSLVTGLGNSIRQATQRIEAEISEVLASVKQQRVETSHALTAAQAAATQIREDAETHQREHVELWRSNLEQARTALDRAHRSLDEEYRRGMAGFAASGHAFAELTARAVEDVRALPDPAERLASLWDRVRGLESDLTEAITGSVRQMMALREHSGQLAMALANLGHTTSSAAASLESGSGRLGDTLHRELDQMNRIIGEYVSLLETTTQSFQARE